MKSVGLFAAMGLALVAVGLFQSWNVALAILNLSLISAVMALGVNIQWGYAGIFNVGIMGFAALGGMAAVLVAVPPVPAAWSAGGAGIGLAALALAATIGAGVLVVRLMAPGALRKLAMLAVVVLGYGAMRMAYDPAVDAIESVDPAATGYLGGLGLPIVLGWALGGVLAAGVAWVVGKVALGLRSDYLAIATLGISEILIAVMKNEDWLTRGVKNVTGLPRPVPYEVELQRQEWLLTRAADWGMTPGALSGIVVKGMYAFLFALVLAALWPFATTAMRRRRWARMSHGGTCRCLCSALLWWASGGRCW